MVLYDSYKLSKIKLLYIFDFTIVKIDFTEEESKTSKHRTRRKALEAPERPTTITLLA